MTCKRQTNIWSCTNPVKQYAHCLYVVPTQYRYKQNTSCYTSRSLSLGFLRGEGFLALSHKLPRIPYYILTWEVFVESTKLDSFLRLSPAVSGPCAYLGHNVSLFIAVGSFLWSVVNRSQSHSFVCLPFELWICYHCSQNDGEGGGGESSGR